jgi:hypothetical protein
VDLEESFFQKRTDPKLAGFAQLSANHIILLNEQMLGSNDIYSLDSSSLIDSYYNDKPNGLIPYVSNPVAFLKGELVYTVDPQLDYQSVDSVAWEKALKIDTKEVRSVHTRLPDKYKYEPICPSMLIPSIAYLSKGDRLYSYPLERDLIYVSAGGESEKVQLENRISVSNPNGDKLKCRRQYLMSDMWESLHYDNYRKLLYRFYSIVLTPDKKTRGFVVLDMHYEIIAQFEISPSFENPEIFISEEGLFISKKNTTNKVLVFESIKFE